MNEERLINLETKFAHQEVIIEDMQKTIHEQYLVIQKLEKTVNLLKERMKTDFYKGPVSSLAQEKPPHY